MEPVTIALVALLVGVGLWSSARAARAAPAARLRELGLDEVAPNHFAGHVGRFPLELELGPGRQLTFRVALAPRPLDYRLLARALGRGDLLAELHRLRASAAQSLTGWLEGASRSRALSLELARIERLAETLEALPLAEALSRHYLELGDGTDPKELLATLLERFPDAPETLAVCRHELELDRRPDLTALARDHLAARSTEPVPILSR